MNDRHPLDDAIDRTVRDMTHVAADDDAVARVMARLRETDARNASASKGARWILTPRVAWCGVLALLLMVFLGSRDSWRSLNRGGEGRRVAVTAPQQSSQPSLPSLPPLPVRKIPTPVAAAPSITHATTAARIAGRDTVKPASVVNDAADAGERLAHARDARAEMAPLESDIVVASITPAPLGDVPAIHVAPLMTTALTVDEIPVPSIDVSPVSPEQHN
jgi:hypothetical protein